MILVDANLLLYASFDDVPQHPAAVRWLDEQLSTGVRVALPWHVLLAFQRIATNARVWERPMPAERAWSQIETWLDVAGVWIPGPTARHRNVLGRLLRETHATGNLVPDAHLAALAIEHGLLLCSADTDFGRFPDLRWSNPLRP